MKAKLESLIILGNFNLGLFKKHFVLPPCEGEIPVDEEFHFIRPGATNLAVNLLTKEGVPIEDGEIRQWFGNELDVPVRHKARRALVTYKRNLDLHHSEFDSINNLIWMGRLYTSSSNLYLDMMTTDFINSGKDDLLVSHWAVVKSTQAKYDELVQTEWPRQFIRNESDLDINTWRQQ